MFQQKIEITLNDLSKKTLTTKENEKRKSKLAFITKKYGDAK